MRVEVEIVDESGQPYRALLRHGTASDRLHLVTAWVPVLNDGPEHWLDREWRWARFGTAELAFSKNPEWLVLTDEVAPAARGDVLGVLVTTAPVTAADAALTDVAAAAHPMAWVEYIANAPFVRRDCPAARLRRPFLRGIGEQLMFAAITRSDTMGLRGRLGLHAEGDVARRVYTRWNMRELSVAKHPAGGEFPVFFGDEVWATAFRSRARQ